MWLHAFCHETPLKKKILRFLYVKRKKKKNVLYRKISEALAGIYPPTHPH